MEGTEILQMLSNIINLSVPTGLVVVSIWFILNKLWPWWEVRDHQQRERELERFHAEMEARSKEAAATEVLAISLGELSSAVKTIHAINAIKTDRRDEFGYPEEHEHLQK